MKLDQFILANMDRLLNEWEEAVLEIAPELKNKASVALRDHAGEMLHFIVADLKTYQSEDESARKALGKGHDLVSDVGGEHGEERRNQGMSIQQMVQELRALRARITKAWSDEHQGLTTEDIEELVRFNEAIDQLIATSMASFSALKDQVTRLLDTMLKVSPDPAAIFRPDCRYLFLNAAMADLLSVDQQDAIGKTPVELGLQRAQELHNVITASVNNADTQHRENFYSFPSGRESYLDCQYVPVFNEINEVEAIVKTTRDITERRQNEDQAWRHANFDLLTGLPNRRLFLDRLEQTLLESERKNNSFTILFIDLDGFKQVNDQLGHRIGDQLLAQVADRINTNVRVMDTVARLGGDEFTVVMKDSDKEGAKLAAKVLLTCLEKPFDVDSHQLQVSASIGLTRFPDDASNIEQLVDNADKAMYAAKDRGGHQVLDYQPWMGQS